LVYCFEHPDNGGKAMNIILPDNVVFTTRDEKDLLGGVVTLEGKAPVVTVSADGTTVSTETKTIKAIPYYSWANRGKGEMQVWIPRKATNIQLRSSGQVSINH